MVSRNVYRVSEKPQSFGAIPVVSFAKGRIAIVTGANTGIGLATAQGLAAAGAHVVLACRDVQKGAAALDKVRCNYGEDSARLVRLDLASFVSVRSCASALLALEGDIAILVNNAGAMPMRQNFTEEGFEFQFGVNYLGHFLLTELLRPRLITAAPARIVHVSSVMHRFGRIDPKTFWGFNRYHWSRAYAQSKLANMLYAFYLARQMEGDGVASNAVHPGVVGTDIARGMPRFLQSGFRRMARTPQEGAQGSLALALSPEFDGITGRYMAEGRLAAPARKAQNRSFAARFYEQSLSLVGL
ncbi:MAG: SDR family oxidoreductase [Pseudomonadota bacterium]